MQTLTFYVTADSTLGAVRDYANAKNASAPTLTRGVSACLKMRVFANAENADPYVTIGDNIKKGQTLCIIEAMKLMNEITAEEDGVILEICVTNGQVVEYGTELFRVKR